MNQLYPFKDKRPKLGENVYVAPTASVIGDVEIGEQSSVWFGCTVRGDVNYIRIGRRTNIQDGTVIHVASVPEGQTLIGDNVTIGHMALIHACQIGDNAFIGMKACLMDGAVVEPGAMIAAGALVTQNKIVKSGQLWAGTPAKYLRDLTNEEKEFLEFSAQRYVNLADAYMTD